MAHIRLDMISTSGLSRSFCVSERGCVIGRSVRANIRVGLPSVAPRHAMIEFVDGRGVIRPFDQETVDVFLNDKVVPFCGCLINDADVIRIGMTSFKVRASSNTLAESAIEVKGTVCADVQTESPNSLED